MIERLLRVPGGNRERLDRISSGHAEPADQLWACPWKLLETPDPWQRDVLSDPCSDWILNCSRQSGKSTVAEAQAVWEAQCAGSFVLVVSASEAQAYEFFARTLKCYNRLRVVEPIEEPTKSQLLLSNGGRILALPNNEKTVRVYSNVGRIIIDEASRVPDTLYGAVSPMLAVAKGRKTLLSTPFGKRGFFYKAWTEGIGWRRKKIPWNLCPRISKSFIESELREHGQLWVEQEYECQFLDLVSGIFDVEAFAGLVDSSVDVISW